ncbi:MAG TPA: lysophospholipid acyltransferase family protein [Opitutaceae bacterium]|nr:lysophospholipid acyltransferase family protein [Opitutaceae bacterium]
MRRAWIYVRAVGRGIRMAFVLVGPALSHWFTAPKYPTIAWRTAWLQRWCSHTSRAAGVTIRVTGTPASHGIVASNHLSYLDILVLASISPQVFLAKSDVRNWPVMGKYAEWAGTQFIDRTRRADVARQNEEFRRIVENDAVQTIFLEGTSSGGASVLPFKSSLLEPVVANGWPVTPAAIVYTCKGGVPSEHVCWWRDMPFTPHALGLLLLDSITAHVSFGTPVAPGDDRKALAARLHAEVSTLKTGIEAGLR